jgi:required for meiotic nuclear division protein 1
MSAAHAFFAYAFEQNLASRDVAKAYPKGKVTSQEVTVDVDGGGQLFIYPFGALVVTGLGPEQRDAELAAFREKFPKLTLQIAREELTVIEDPEKTSGAHEGKLTVGELTRGRASVIALTIAQSAAMEYYERIVDELHAETASLVDRLETRGNVPFGTRPLHKFIGRAISVRTEVLTILHLLDRPDATWDDPGMDAIYTDLKENFDLGDRYEALESKLKSVQEALTLVLDVARDFRLVLLEATIVALIVLEIIIGLVRH